MTYSTCIPFRCFARRTAAFALLAVLACGCDVGAPVGNPIPNDADTQGDSLISSTRSPGSSELEQLALERINRARLLPAREAERGGIAIDEGIPGQLDTTPKPAVALNTTLRTAARAHALDMLDRDFFAHVNPDGDTPGDRVLASGFVWTTVGENLAWNGTTGTLDPTAIVEEQHDNLFVDRGIEGRGHRLTMLHEDLREVGIAVVRGSFTADDGVTYTDSIMQAQEYATGNQGTMFVLGVVYSDSNSNGQYDFGEGTAGETVILSGIETTTNAGGGYVFEILASGNYTITFRSAQQFTFDLTAGDANIKIDSIDNARISVNLGLGQLR